MKRTITIFALLFALSSIVFARGNEKHVMGKVNNISSTSFLWKPPQRRRFQ